MAVLADRVKETSTTTGTGSYTLAGAVAGFRTFDDVLATGETTLYAVTDGTDWETGVGTFTAPSTLARTTVLASSNGGAAVSWAAGSKTVFITVPADRTVHMAEQGAVEIEDRTSDPAAPASGLLLYTRPLAGRRLPRIIDPSGVDVPLQPSLFGNNTCLWLPGTGTTAAINWGGSWTVGATQAHPAIATTNMLASMKRATFTTTTTSGNAAGVRLSAAQFWRGNAAGLGGFFFHARFGVLTFQAAMEIWVGLSAKTGLLAGAPSAQANTVAIGKDTGDTNWQLIFSDATTATKVDLGLSVAANQVIDAMFFAPPNGSNITARVRRLDVDSVLADNTVHTANIPQSTALLLPHAECRTNAASAVAIALNRIYVESDI